MYQVVSVSYIHDELTTLVAGWQGWEDSFAQTENMLMMKHFRYIIVVSEAYYTDN